eukprot:365320-Chlamydomonas_euryale.AAC.5
MLVASLREHALTEMSAPAELLTTRPEKGVHHHLTNGNVHNRTTGSAANAPRSRAASLRGLHAYRCTHIAVLYRRPHHLDSATAAAAEVWLAAGKENLCCASCRLWFYPFEFAPHRHTLGGAAPCSSDADSAGRAAHAFTRTPVLKNCPMCQPCCIPRNLTLVHTPLAEAEPFRVVIPHTHTKPWQRGLHTKPWQRGLQAALLCTHQA